MADETPKPNGVVNALGLSKRSIAELGSAAMILKLVTVDPAHRLLAMLAMGLIALLAVAYMVADEIKSRRESKP